MSATRINHVLAGLLFVVAGRSVFGQEAAAPRELPIPVPEETRIDDTTWRRLTDGYADEKRAFMHSLLVLDASLIDYAADSLADIQRKQRSVGQAFGGNVRSAMDRMSDAELQVDYLRVAWEVMPRLSGRVVEVEQGRKNESLDQTLLQLKAGDWVALPAGTFRLNMAREARLPSDLAWVGAGSERTTLTVTGGQEIEGVERWRVANLKIDCGGERESDDPFAGFGEDERGGPLPCGTIHVQRCAITGVDFHHGAIAGGRFTVVEDCTVQGGGHPFSTSLFDHSWHQQPRAVYVRRSRFTNIGDFGMHGDFPVVLDRCQWKSKDPHGRVGRAFRAHDIHISSSHLLTRDTSGISAHHEQKFNHAIDDKETVEYVLGLREDAEPRVVRLADALKLSRNPYYWIGLLRQSDDQIRRTAADRIRQLFLIDVRVPDQPTEEPTSPPTEDEISVAIQNLDSDEFEVRKAARQKLTRIGKPAVEALTAITTGGGLEQQRSAEQILDKIAAAASSREPALLPQAWEFEYGRLSRWYESQRNKLAWDESRGAYVAKTPRAGSN